MIAETVGDLLDEGYMVLGAANTKIRRTLEQFLAGNGVPATGWSSPGKRTHYFVAPRAVGEVAVLHPGVTLVRRRAQRLHLHLGEPEDWRDQMADIRR